MRSIDWIAEIEATTLGPKPFSARRRKRPRLGPPSEVEHIQFPFRRWDGEIGPWSDHFGKGRSQVYPLRGQDPTPSCNEIEVAKRLRIVRDNAFWFSGFGVTAIPERWRPWVLSCSEMPDWLIALDARIRKQLHAATAGMYSGDAGDGMPDVVAWNQDQPLVSAIFVECKGSEGFGESQEDWIWAVRRIRVPLSRIAVSVRPF